MKKFGKVLIGLLLALPLTSCGAIDLGSYTQGGTGTGTGTGGGTGGHIDPPAGSITVSRALEIANGLEESSKNNEHPTTETYTIYGYVDNSFDPKAGEGSKYSFNMVDSQGGNSLICWYLSSTFGTPVKGDYIVINAHLEKYVDSKTKLEAVNGSVVSEVSQGGGSGTGGGTTTTYKAESVAKEISTNIYGDPNQYEYDSDWDEYYIDYVGDGSSTSDFSRNKTEATSYVPNYLSILGDWAEDEWNDGDAGLFAYFMTNDETVAVSVGMYVYDGEVIIQYEIFDMYEE